MQQEGEGRSTADTARESRQHEEKAAGPAAQFTHHETASTQGRHTTPAATHHAGGEDIHHHIHIAHLYSQREMAKNPRPPHNARGASTHHTSHTTVDPHPSTTRHQTFQPSRPQWDTEPNSAQPHAVHHTRRKEDSGCALPLPSLLLIAMEEDNSRHTQLPACTAKEAFKSIAMCILCVCACRNTKQRSRKDSRVCGETQKNVQRRCMAEATRRRPLKLTTALQSRQWQFTQDLFKTKNKKKTTFPFILHKPHHTK
ncbi:hypothetical protein ECC02_012539 [Trypanosoma cruzi]|uniref:Uncharacterized protein n=1 Tax=Trypanosoma cruzi TaxID=5693 RepID=A0A7J6XJX0_TRYCR|nr:hypothetical protein ECC02_012539 [Trypanosoma cruzi]